MIGERRSYQLLAWAGALPFAAAALLAIAGVAVANRPLPGATLAASYGLAILSFLCGVHWGTYLYRHEDSPINLFVSSNVIVVVVWIAYLVMGLSPFTLAVQVLAFLYLLYIDARFRCSGLISKHYYRVRLQATAVAVASLLVVIAFGF